MSQQSIDVEVTEPNPYPLDEAVQQDEVPE